MVTGMGLTPETENKRKKGRRPPRRDIDRPQPLVKKRKKSSKKQTFLAVVIGFIIGVLIFLLFVKLMDKGSDDLFPEELITEELDPNASPIGVK